MDNMQMPILDQGNVQGRPMMVAANPYAFMPTLEKMRNVHGIFVKQKAQYLEELTGCEQNNKYFVNACDKQGDNNKNVSLFKCVEKSSYCARNCLSANCRPFNMKVTHHTDDNQGNDDQDAVFFEREYQWTCCCFNRPQMKVYVTEENQKHYLGMVKQPFNLCTLEIEILDNNNETVYFINGSVCQCGICCGGFPCEQCQTVDFQILDKHRNQVGTCQKRFPGCMKTVFSDADNFSMIFPESSTPEERVLLMGGLILMDFSYFEDKGKKQQ